VTGPRAGVSSALPIRVFSIDDHEIVHMGIEHVAQASGNLVFVGATADLATAEQQVAEQKPDLVLLDLYIGDEQGWDVCRRLLAFRPDLRVVFYTAYGNAQLVARAVALGASGFLLKTTSMSDLPAMLQTAVTTGQVIDPFLLAEWAAAQGRGAAAVQFSDQERIILSYIASGLDNHEIAEQMHLSFHTVKFHIGKMLRRTEESNRAGLVRYAKEHFLLD
jgi:two-component system, NarL family, response regulator DevR